MILFATTELKIGARAYALRRIPLILGLYSGGKYLQPQYKGKMVQPPCAIPPKTA